MCETAVCFFNKQVAEDYDVPNLYSLVDEGTWTFDRLYDIASGISHDVDGDGNMTENDMYGCIQNLIVGIYSFQTAADYHTVLKGDDGVTLNIMTDKMQSILEYVNKLCYENYTSYVDEFDYAKDSKGVEIFFDNRALFLMATLEHGEYFRQFDADFGIIPYPKYDEKQSDYYSLISTILTPGVSIPVTNNEPEKAGLILEALAYYSVDTLTHAYYDTALNNRYIRDEDSGEMLDIIFASRVYDFGFIFDVGGMGTLIQNLFNSRKNNFISQYEKYEKKALVAIADLMASFEGAQ
jgi:hypothetical protein